MSIEAIVAVVVAAAVALATLAGALWFRRLIMRSHVPLMRLEKTMDVRSTTVADDLVGIRARASDSGHAAERALDMLTRLDVSMEAAKTALRERRAASDSLRASIVSNRGALLRVRNSARLLIRAIELRRDFLA